MKEKAPYIKKYLRDEPDLKRFATLTPNERRCWVCREPHWKNNSICSTRCLDIVRKRFARKGKRS